VAESTRYAVLGLLAQRPSYGYALVESLARWPLDDVVGVPRQRSIYRALETLHKAGLIAPQQLPHDREPDGPNRERYGATAAGQEQLAAWLRAKPESFGDLCMRILAARREDLPIILAAVASVEQDCLARLQEVQVPDAAALAARGSSWPAVTAVLLQLVEAGEIASHLGLLREIRRVLETVADSEPREGRIQ
jgi:DNA-binding PadR family transcriptional regulator